MLFRLRVDVINVATLTCSADRDAPGGGPGGGRQGGEGRGMDAASAAAGCGDAGQGRQVGAEAVEAGQGADAGAESDAGGGGVLGHLGWGALWMTERCLVYQTCNDVGSANV